MELILGATFGVVSGVVFTLVCCRKVMRENVLLHSKLKAVKNHCELVLGAVARDACLEIRYSLNSEGFIDEVEISSPKSYRDAETGRYVKKLGTTIEVLKG